MSRLPMLALILAVAAVSACKKDEEGIAGTFNLVITETEDTCDGDENSFSTSISIEAAGEDDVTVTFGDQAVLTGFVDDQGIIQAQGPAMVPVPVEGDTLLVQSSMRIQLAVRRSRVDGNGDLAYDGTHPGAPGEQCEQDFNVAGQRANLAPILPTESR